MNKKLNEMFSLSLRMGRHLTKNEADRLTEAISDDAVIFNIDSFSPDLMENINRDYRDFGQNYVYGNPLIKEGKQYIKETYGQIFDADDVIKHLCGTYHFADEQFYKVEAFNGIAIYLLIADIGENHDLIVNDMSKMGYFLSVEKPLEKDGHTLLQMRFEPITQKDETETIKKENKYFYHFTQSENIPSIMTTGLTPRNDNMFFSYPPRIYLVKSNVTMNDLYDLGEDLSLKNLKDGIKGKYTLLGIHTDRLPDTVHLFYDPNYEHGVFTTDTIPNNCIQVGQEYQFRYNH